MVKLSGLQVRDVSHPKGDIEIQYTGLRPGEKLYEELLVDGKFAITKNKLIMRAEEGMIEWEQLEPLLTKIEEAAINIDTSSDNRKVYKLISQIVPEFNSQSNESKVL